MLTLLSSLTNNLVFFSLALLGVAGVGVYFARLHYRGLGFQTTRPRFWLLILLLGFTVIYLINLDGYQINDDEGGYLYASWRISSGEVPYRDFMTPQMPLFLYTGASLFHYFQPSLYIVRLLTVLTVIVSALFLYLLGKEFFDSDHALFAILIYLSNYLVFFHSRSYRSDPIMMALALAALYFLGRGEKHGGWHNFFLAGFLFGFATSYKLFGVFPMFGVGLFWLYQLFRERITFNELSKKAFLTICGLVIVPLITVGGMYLVEPDLYDFLVGHHIEQGSDWSTWQVIAKTLALLGKFMIHNQILTALVVLGIYVVAKEEKRRLGEPLVLLFLLASLILFFFLPRPGYNRHMLFLFPVYSLLMAKGLLYMFTWQRMRWRSLAFSLFVVYFLTNLGVNWQRGRQKEFDTQKMARLIQKYVAPTEYIVADYASLAFHSRRRMPPLLGGASHGSIASGQTTVDDYTENIEKYQVKMLIIQNDGHGTIQTLANYGKLRLLLKEKYRRIFHDYRREKDTFDIYLKRVD